MDESSGAPAAATLRPVKFQELFDSGKLPSGFTFELMPDTVGIGLKVAECGEKVPWKRKAEQAGVTVASVAGEDIQSMKPKDRVTYFGAMLDTDVAFLSMAWLAQTNDTSIKLDPSSNIPCPTCGARFERIPFGGLVVHSREAPVGGPNSHYPLDLEPSLLPASMREGRVLLVDPTWMAARQAIPENSWDDHVTVRVHRIGASMRFVKGADVPRMLSRKGEFEQLRTRVIERAASALDLHVPYIERHFGLECTHCGSEVRIPFDLGL